MKVLVTGGTGYIGSHIVVELLQNGYQALIVDDLSNSYIQILGSIEKITGKKVEFYQLNMTNLEELKAVFVNENIDCIIHCAARKNVHVSVHSPLDYYYNNIVATINLLKCMDQFKVNKLIYSSSATVYDNTKNPPYKEQSQLHPCSPYGWTKLMCEQIIQDYCHANLNLQALSLRYFNPIESHPSGLLQQKGRGENYMLFPNIVKVKKEQLPYITIHGGDYNTVDGTCIRDFTNVCTLANMHILALSLFQAGKHKIYNIGTGVGTTIKQMCQKYVVPYIIEKRRDGDAPSWYADTNKFLQDLKI